MSTAPIRQYTQCIAVGRWVQEKGGEGGAHGGSNIKNVLRFGVWKFENRETFKNLGVEVDECLKVFVGYVRRRSFERKVKEERRRW